MPDALRIEHRKGVQHVYPTHPMVASWLFDEYTHDEAMLCHYMAVVAAKSGMDANDMQHLFPAVLRILKSSSGWSA